jgi:cell division cycle protein 20 (cofactor of APC complex)
MKFHQNKNNPMVTSKINKHQLKLNKIYDAPEIVDENHTQLLDWNCSDSIAIGLKNVVYSMNTKTRWITPLKVCDENNFATGISRIDGHMSVRTSFNNNITIHDNRTQKELAIINLESRTTNMDWYSNNIITTGDQQGNIFAFDIRQPKLPSQKFQHHLSPVCNLKWNQTKLASGSNDGLVTIWDNRKNTPQTIIHGHNSAVTALVWSPFNSQILCTCEYNKIRLWNIVGKEKRCVSTSSKIHSLIWSGDYIISGHNDSLNNVKVWSDKLNEIQSLSKHVDKVLDMATNPDANLLATVSIDERLILWTVNGTSGFKEPCLSDGMKIR